MINELFAASLASIWTGIITSISPCPLATNIAALTYISQHSGRSNITVLAYSGLYAMGRAFAYIIIGFLLVKSMLSVPSFSFFMQRYGNQVLSPILVLSGMYMLGMFGQGFVGFNLFDLSKFKIKTGVVFSMIMGFLFALAFCPISAALYFGVIIPLAAKNSSPFFIPMLYGLGTALPVVSVALALYFGLKKISFITGSALIFEKYAKDITAWVFISAGVYLGLKYIFEII